LIILFQGFEGLVLHSGAMGSRISPVCIPIRVSLAVVSLVISALTYSLAGFSKCTIIWYVRAIHVSASTYTSKGICVRWNC
jgi:hypothetical protein